MIKFGNIEVYGVIYKIENLINNKVYIGQTTKGFNNRYPYKGIGMERVYSYYLSNSNRNVDLLNDIINYGIESFNVVEVLDVAFSMDELNTKEQTYILIFDSFKNGYNQNTGGHNFRINGDFCEVCGRFGVKSKNMCKKHYRQFSQYGYCLDNNPRTYLDPNEIVIYEDYAEVVLYDDNCNEKSRAIIDVEDVKNVSKYKWHSLDNNTVFCEELSMYLHHFILNNDSRYILHINNNNLDNRKSNLSIGVKLNSGVSFRKDRNKWRAYIHYNKKQITLGSFDTKEEAQRARGEAMNRLLKGETL